MTFSGSHRSPFRIQRSTTPGTKNNYNTTENINRFSVRKTIHIISCNDLFLVPQVVI